MTLKECYNAIGANFDSAVTRMCNKETMLLKFAKKFPNDPTYKGLIDAFENNDPPTAFRMAHTLKGLCLNLGFDKLQGSASELTEALRDKQEFPENAAALLETVKADYNTVVTAVNAVDD